MSQVTADPTRFRAFEVAGWAARADAYHRFFSPISARLVGPLLDAARVGAHTRVLDLASGPGYVAAEAAALGAPVVGIDASPDMVRLATALHPALTFRQADAEHLPFDDRTFDAVVGNLLLHHLAAPEQGVAEAVRVLTPGGWLALTVWDVPARSRLMGVIVDAVQEAGGGAPADMPPGPPVFQYAADGAFVALLEGSCLTDVVVHTHTFTHHLPDADAYWKGMLTATVRTAALITGQPRAVQQRIRTAVERLLAPYATPTGVDLPIAVKVAAGRRPR